MYAVFFSDLKNPRVALVDSVGFEDWSSKLAPEFSAYPVAKEADLNAVPAVALVALYNSTKDVADRIQKFTDRATAARRVYPFLAKLGGADLSTKPMPKKTATGGPCSAAKGKRLGIGTRMAELLRAGKTTDEVLQVIKAEFPLSRATSHDVSIIRRKNNIMPLTAKAAARQQNQKAATHEGSTKVN